MNNLLLNPFVWIIFAIIIFVLFNKKKEGYSQAALIQLTAKGPQDTYLTGDAWKYIPPWYYGGYGGYGGYGRYGGWYSGYPWNISTRLGKRPYYWNYPYRYY